MTHPAATPRLAEVSDPNEPVQPEHPTGAQPLPPSPPPSAPPPPTGSTPYAADPYGGGAGTGSPYGAPPTDDTPYSATEAISYGWRKFWAHPSTLLVPMIVVFVGIVVAELIIQFVVIGGFFGSSSGFLRQWLGLGLGSALMNLIVTLLAAGLYKGATNVTDGQPFSVGEMFEGWDKVQVAIAAIFIAVATFIGTVICLLPGILIAFLTPYTLFFIVDQKMEAAEAIKGSVQLVWNNIGHALLYDVLAAIVLIVGAVLCGVGLLIAGPIALIGLAYTYRRLQLQPVVP